MLVVLQSIAGELTRLSLKPGSLTVAVGNDSVDTFDACGRWLGGVEPGLYWRRGLDHRVVGAPKGQRPALPVDEPGRAALLRRVHARVAQVAKDWQRGASVPSTALPADVQAAFAAALADAVAFTPDALARDAAAFCALYGGPIAAFPGELYRSLYLQTTIGCAWNRCSYCTLYAGQRARVRHGEDLAAHVAAVCAYFGPALQMRRSAFLGDADAFLAGAAGLIEQLHVLARFFSTDAESPAAGRHVLSAYDAFGAPDSVLRCGVEDLRSLAGLGLRRVYLGLETGCEALRLTLRRREPLADLCAAVARLHEAGIAVGLTVLAGVGGQVWQERHCSETIALLHSLDLDERDVVSLSPLDADPASSYAQSTLGATPLGPAACHTQAEQLRVALQGGWPRREPRCAPYDLSALIS